MDGPKDEATRKYEREIRIGMSLLGLLALAFVGVLARRVWMDNSQVSASQKKPIYLSRAERDALRAKSKPLPLFSVNASTPRNLAEPSRTELRAAAQAKLEREAEEVPDLDIEATDEPVSQPASFTEQEPTAKATPNTPVEPSRDLPPKEKATPIPPSTNPDDEQDALPEQTPETADVEKPPSSRFSARPKPLEPEREPPTAANLNPPPAEPTRDEEPVPSQTEDEKVRKKAERNPWKRAGSESTEKTKGPRHSVAKGETLKSIAREYLGDETRWREIYDLNRDLIGDDFGYLKVGLKLRLPPVQEAAPSEGDPSIEANQVRDPK